MPIPVRLINSANAASVAGGLADARFFPADDLVFRAENDRNVCGGVIPMLQVEFIKALTGGIAPAAWYRYGVGMTPASWADQSGNGRTLLQATGTNQPTLDSDGSLLFDGVDNFMATGAFTLNQPETIYLLAKQVTWAIADSLFDGAASAGGKIRQGATTPGIALNGGATTSDLIAPALGSYSVITAIFNGTSSGASNGTGAFTVGNAGTNNLGGITIGAGGGGGLQWANVAFKEVIVFPTAHDETTRRRVIRYLQQVGGI